jgi:AAA+ ATPase superfamily predicted ATPase
MDFFGRQSELAALEERFQSDNFEFGVIYGRRRVGKTTLLSEFAKGRPTIFFSALRSSAEENLAFLSAAIIDVLGTIAGASAVNGLSSAVYSTFQDAFDAVFAIAEEKRLVLIIDEYPYLIQSYPAVSSLLQHLVDRHKSTSRLLLVLSGSSMTQMHREFFTANRPLYGRKTFQIKVKPFGFFEMKEGFDKASLNPNLMSMIYAVYGGTPKYFEGYDEYRSLKRNVMRDFLTIGAPLLDEPESVLKQEIRESASYNTLFSAIAGGANRYSELSSKARLESGNISAYLDNLVFLDLIRREVPSYTAEKKKTLYRIDDNFFCFWYRFIPRNLSLINAGRQELAYQYINANLDQYMGGAFEQICLEYLWQLNGSERLPFAFAEAGRWWGTDASRKCEAEIDILAHNNNDSAIFCECKWSAKQVGEDILTELAERTTLPQFSRLTQRHLALFSKSGFTRRCQQLAETMKNVSLFTLEDMLRR